EDAAPAAARVDQRSAREARVGRRVRADVLLEEPPARAGGATDRAHDPDAGHELTATPAAYGEDELAPARGSGRAARRLAPETGHAQHGEIACGVPADDLRGEGRP